MEKEASTWQVHDLRAGFRRLIEKNEDPVQDFERRKRDVDWYPAVSSADANVAWDRVDDEAPAVDLNAVADADHWASVLIAARKARRAAEAEINECETMLKEIPGNQQ